MLRYNNRDLILKKCRQAGSLTWNGANLSFFPDYSSTTAKKRGAFSTVRKKMREAGIQSFLLYPATLKGETHMLHTPEDAQGFLRMKLTRIDVCIM